MGGRIAQTRRRRLHPYCLLHQVKYDIHPAEIHNRIVNTFSVDRMRFYGFALNERLRIYPAQRVALMAFSLRDQERFGVNGEDMEGLVNYTLMMRRGCS